METTVAGRRRRILRWWLANCQNIFLLAILLIVFPYLTCLLIQDQVRAVASKMSRITGGSCRPSAAVEALVAMAATLIRRRISGKSQCAITLVLHA